MIQTSLTTGSETDFATAANKKVTNRSIAILILILLCAMSHAFAGTPIRIHVSKDAFMYIKADKSMLGGEIQIHNSKGALVKTLVMDQCKFFVDFFDLEDGIYTITLHRADLLIEFAYSLEGMTHHVQPNSPHHQRHQHHPHILALHGKLGHIK
jgi:hypothetical protein